MRIVVVLLPALVLFVGLLLTAAVRPQPQLPVDPGSRLAHVRRHTNRWRWAGVVLGAVSALGAIQVDGALGRGVMLAAPLFALGVLLGVVVGELRVAAPSVPARSARLEVRRIRDYVPRRLAGIVAATAGMLGLLLVVTTAVGSPDDLGRAGRTLVRACSEVMTSRSGPWPGSFYSLPLGGIVLGGLAAAAFALQQVVRRPRQGEDVGVDDQLRRTAATAVIAATGILVAVPLAATSAIAAIVLSGSSCPRWWTTALAWLLVAFVPLAGVLAIRCAALLVSPARSRPRHEVG